MDYSKFEITSAEYLREDLNKKVISNNDVIKTEFRRNIIDDILYKIKEKNKNNVYSFSDTSLYECQYSNTVIEPNKNNNIEINGSNFKLLKKVIESITKDPFILYSNMDINFTSDLNIENIIDEELKEALRVYLLEKDIQIVNKYIKENYDIRKSSIEIRKGSRTYFDDLKEFLSSKGYKVSINDYVVVIKY